MAQTENTMSAEPKGAVWIRPGWGPVEVAFIPNETAWKRELGKIDRSMAYPTDAAATSYFDLDNGTRYIFVTLHEKYDTNPDHLTILGLIAHEAAHVWRWAREHMHETEPALEQEAYAIQTVFLDIAWAIRDTRIPDFFPVNPVRELVERLEERGMAKAEIAGLKQQVKTLTEDLVQARSFIEKSRQQTEQITNLMLERDELLRGHGLHSPSTPMR